MQYFQNFCDFTVNSMFGFFPHEIRLKIFIIFINFVIIFLPEEMFTGLIYDEK